MRDISYMCMIEDKIEYYRPPGILGVATFSFPFGHVKIMFYIHYVVSDVVNGNVNMLNDLFGEVPLIYMELAKVLYWIIFSPAEMLSTQCVILFRGNKSRRSSKEHMVFVFALETVILSSHCFI
jgi:hypothetical protein